MSFGKPPPPRPGVIAGAAPPPRDEDLPVMIPFGYTVETWPPPARAPERQLQDALKRLPGNSAQELAGPLALAAMRELETQLQDRDPRIRRDAARAITSATPKLAELPVVAPVDEDPEARRAAMLAALTSDEAVALVVEVARSSEAPLRLALERDGWTRSAG